MTMKHRKT